MKIVTKQQKQTSDNRKMIIFCGKQKYPKEIQHNYTAIYFDCYGEHLKWSVL